MIIEEFFRVVKRTGLEQQLDLTFRICYNDGIKSGSENRSKGNCPRS